MMPATKNLRRGSWRVQPPSAAAGQSGQKEPAHDSLVILSGLDW